MAIDNSNVTQSRRALLAGALGGLAAAVATALGRPGAVSAAAGSTMIIGSEANNAGSANTQLLTNSSVAAFKLLQNGPGTALMGYATPATGATRGVYGRTDSADGYGVQARNAGLGGTGAAIQAIGVYNHGVDASTNNSNRSAVKGVNSAPGGAGLLGEAPNGYGVFGLAVAGTGVHGDSTGGYGTYGHSAQNIGVYGWSNASFGVFGLSAGSYAGYFEGALYAESASAAVKNFKIDHPLDPAGKVLMHSCVESDERLTVYAGTITTDAAGEATVELPEWFDALNRDLRYQLTVIGSFAQAMIKRKVAGNRFTVATSEPATEVCWQISGVRQDAYAKAHPLEVDKVKTGRERGRYLNPLEHGQPESVGVTYELRQAGAGRSAAAVGN